MGRRRREPGYSGILASSSFPLQSPRRQSASASTNTIDELVLTPIDEPAVFHLLIVSRGALENGRRARQQPTAINTEDTTMSEENTEEADPLIGQTVENIREMTDEEMETEGWNPNTTHTRPAAIEFDDGAVVYASTDPEGNGPGALFGMRGDTPFAFAP